MVSSVQLNAAGKREKKRRNVVTDILTSRTFKVALGVGTLVGASIYYACTRQEQLELVEEEFDSDQERIVHAVQNAVEEVIPLIVERVAEIATQGMNSYLLEKEEAILQQLSSQELKDEFRAYLDKVPHAAPDEIPEMSVQLDEALADIINAEDVASYLQQKTEGYSDSSEDEGCSQP